MNTSVDPTSQVSEGQESLEAMLRDVLGLIDETVARRIPNDEVEARLRNLLRDDVLGKGADISPASDLQPSASRHKAAVGGIGDYSTFGNPTPVPALTTQVGHITVRTTWVGASAATARPVDLPLVWVTEVYPGDPQNHGSTNAGRSHSQAKAYEMHWLTVRRLEHWARLQTAAAGHGSRATAYGVPRRRVRGWLRSLLGD